MLLLGQSSLWPCYPASWESVLWSTPQSKNYLSKYKLKTRKRQSCPLFVPLQNMPLGNYCLHHLMGQNSQTQIRGGLGNCVVGCFTCTNTPGSTEFYWNLLKTRGSLRPEIENIDAELSTLSNNAIFSLKEAFKYFFLFFLLQPLFQYSSAQVHIRTWRQYWSGVIPSNWNGQQRPEKTCRINGCLVQTCPCTRVQIHQRKRSGGGTTSSFLRNTQILGLWSIVSSSPKSTV